MASITLSNPQIIVLQQQKTKTIDTITAARVVDVPGMKIVKAYIKELNTTVTLWEGAAYDSIGQWTDADVQTRLTQIYGATAS